MVETIVQPLTRPTLAGSRIAQARQALRDCRLCAHQCGVDRWTHPKNGRCGADGQARVFSFQTEVSDELDLIPVFAIAFSGCDLRCDFCLTGAESWNPAAGVVFDPKSLAKSAARALEKGARSIMILGGEPTIHLPSVLELVAELPEAAKLIWKTNGHATAHARQLLDGLFDLWLVDYKFGNDACARRLAQVPNYTERLRENLRWADQRSRLWVRHLLMPGHVDCCWQPVAAWLHQHLPQTKVSLGDSYWPAWRARGRPELDRWVSREELGRARRIAQDYELSLIR